MHQFHIGPLGRLRLLPSPSLGAGPDATATRLGVVHRSLGGRVTVDRFAVKRVWILSWPYLDADSHAFLDALHLGVLAGPVWLIDPQRRNRIHGRIAATGAFHRSTNGFTATAGTLAWSATVPDVGVPIAGGLAWTAAAGAALSQGDVVPLVPGESITASAFVAATVPISVRVELYDHAGTALPPLTSPENTPGTAGARITLTAPPNPVAVTARMSILAQSAGPVATAGWQLEHGTTATAWTPGGGAAEVAVDAFTTAYPLPDAHACALTLLEI